MFCSSQTKGHPGDNTWYVKYAKVDFGNQSCNCTKHPQLTLSLEPIPASPINSKLRCEHPLLQILFTCSTVSSGNLSSKNIS